ncbi:MAG: hypothetical protein C0503_07845 [Gemmatimonas sp.]|nr:hypothetical protein [Gemmatimonas sp.]
MSKPTTEAQRAATPRSRWRQPLSFEVQCWIAWSGLFAFGLSGILIYKEVGAYPPLELGAVVLAICWAIDLARTGRALRANRAEDSARK